jgi:hypothetical protein
MTSGNPCRRGFEQLIDDLRKHFLVNMLAQHLSDLAHCSI